MVFIRIYDAKSLKAHILVGTAESASLTFWFLSYRSASFHPGAQSTEIESHKPAPLFCLEDAAYSTQTQLRARVS